MDTTRTSWTTQAENELRALRDVEAVSIEADGDDIRELHVLSRSRRPAKQIVRDVQAVLMTRFKRSIDHRVVSIAFTDVERTNGTAHGTPAHGARAAAAEAAPAPGAASERPAPAARPEPRPAPARPAPAATDDRIRFGSVNLYVSGARAQAQVELRWKGVPRMGSASGWSTREGALRLIAQATLAALQEYLSEEVAIGIDDVHVLSMGRRSVVVASLTLLAHRHEKALVGCCTVEHDAQQAAVLATLAALNRVVGGLRTKEPIEYVLRPAST